jgi:hypothetical protein
MKQRETHRVALSRQALFALQELRPIKLPMWMLNKAGLIKTPASSKRSSNSFVTVVFLSAMIFPAW